MYRVRPLPCGCNGQDEEIQNVLGRLDQAHEGSSDGCDREVCRDVDDTVSTKSVDSADLFGPITSCHPDLNVGSSAI
jgi:hypothetical protein